MRRLALILGLGLLTLAVGTAGAATGNAITVEPTTGLADGDLIRITGGSGDANAALYCPTADVDDCAIVNNNVFGSMDFTVRADRFLVHQNLLLDCATASCHAGGHAVAIDGPAPFVPLRTIYREVLPLEFTPTRAIAARARAGGSVDTGLVAASFLAAPAGSAAFAMRCGAGDRAIVCGDVGSVETDFDGNFTGTVPNPSQLVAGGGTVDCAVVYCAVVVVVLGPGVGVVDVISTPDPRWN